MGSGSSVEKKILQYYAEISEAVKKENVSRKTRALVDANLVKSFFYYKVNQELLTKSCEKLEELMGEEEFQRFFDENLALAADDVQDFVQENMVVPGNRKKNMS